MEWNGTEARKGEEDEMEEKGSEGRREEVVEEEEVRAIELSTPSVQPPLRCPHVCVYNYMTSASVLFHDVISFVKYLNIDTYLPFVER